MFSPCILHLLCGVWNNQYDSILLVTNSTFLHSFWWFVPTLTLRIPFLMILRCGSLYIFVDCMHASHVLETWGFCYLHVNVGLSCSVPISVIFWYQVIVSSIDLPSEDYSLWIPLLSWPLQTSVSPNVALCLVPFTYNRYLVLANMLMESEVNPFDGQEAKP